MAHAAPAEAARADQIAPPTNPPLAEPLGTPAKVAHADPVTTPTGLPLAEPFKTPTEVTQNKCACKRCRTCGLEVSKYKTQHNAPA